MRKVISALGIAMAAAVLGVGSAANAVIVVVDENSPDWVFGPSEPSAAVGTGSGQFEEGPGDPPLPTGSANIVLEGSSGHALFHTSSQFEGLLLRNVTELQYSTYTKTSANRNHALTLQFFVDLDLNDSDDSFQGSLVFEPSISAAVNPVLLNQWQPWDARTESGWWFTSSNTLTDSGSCTPGNPCTLSTIIGTFANAGLRENPTFDLDFLFKGGSGWGTSVQENTVVFDGNVDAFIIRTDPLGQGEGEQTIFNFETAQAVSEPGSLALLGLGLIGFAVSLRRRLRIG